MTFATGDTIAVIGGGTMGRGIALACLAHGFDVHLVDTTEPALAAATEYVTARVDDVRVEADVGTGRCTGFTSIADAVDGAAAVIEAVPEIPDLKHDLFAELMALADARTLLASNTSTLSVTDIAAAAGGCDRVVGMHFFNPADRMKLVEVITAPTTSTETTEHALDLTRRLGKTPIVVSDTPGFVTSRLGLLLGNEAMRIVEEGVATAEDVDTAMRLGYRHPMGPLELADLVGLDARLNNLISVSERTGRPELAPPRILVELVEAGRLGRKTGAGFYDYDADGNRR